MCSTCRWCWASASSRSARAVSITHRRGQRGGRARGDDALRDPSQVADPPAADHVAAGDHQPRGAAGASRRGLRLLSRRRRRRGRRRGEAHGLAGAAGRLPRRGGGTRALRCDDRRDRDGLHAHRPRLLPGRATTEAVLARVRAAMGEVGFWERHATTWALLDAEIMPWSAKAQALIREQYAATGAAARAGLTHAVAPAAAGGRPRSVARASARALRGAQRPRCEVCRGLPPLLLAGDIARRLSHRALPPAGDRGRRAHGQGPPLAHGGGRRAWPSPATGSCSPRRTASSISPTRRASRPRRSGGAS